MQLLKKLKDRWENRHICTYLWHEWMGLKQCHGCGNIIEIPEELISLQYKLKEYDKEII